MRAWVVRRPGPIDDGPLALVERPEPHPGPGELRVRVSVCGVCRTDLHLAEGDLAPRRADVTPGHEIVGVVDELGAGATRFAIGERIGHRVAPPHVRVVPVLPCAATRTSAWRPPSPVGTPTGATPSYAVVDEAYAYALPDVFTDAEAAPLLCAGIIGYRALRRAALPPGGRLGIYGFGGSAHLAAQVAMAEGATVHVITRSADARRLAARPGRGVGRRHLRGPARAARLGDRVRAGR